MFNFLKPLKHLFIAQKLEQTSGIQTFTYFLPAPKQNKSGYREKNFDKVVHNFLNRGYEVIDIKMQVLTHQNVLGAWVLFLVRPLNEEAKKFDSESFGPDFLEQGVHKSEVESLSTMDKDSDQLVELDIEKL